MRFLGLVSCVVLLAATAAPAQMLENFEAGNMFSGGTLVADPEDAGNQVLYVEGGSAAVMTLATPLSGGQGISIKVYDQAKSAGDMVELTADPKVAVQPLVYILDGEGNRQPATDSRSWGHMYGWNVGVSGTYNWGIACLNKSFAGGNGGYLWTGTYYDSWPQTGSSIFSVTWAGLPRQIGPGGLSVIGETGTVAAPEVPGDGAWSTWTYVLNADGSFTITNDGSAVELTSDPALETSISAVYVGSVSGAMGGVWIDDVQQVTGGAVCNPGDADNDGDVDLDDFVILKNNFGTTTGADCSMGDFDDDGDVDLDDFVLLKNNFGS